MILTAMELIFYTHGIALYLYNNGADFSIRDSSDKFAESNLNSIVECV